MSSMKDAFDKAGYDKRSPEERLDALADEAWLKWPQQTVAGARRDFVESALKSEMSYVLFKREIPFQMPQIIGSLLRQAEPKPTVSVAAHTRARPGEAVKAQPQGMAQERRSEPTIATMSSSQYVPAAPKSKVTAEMAQKYRDATNRSAAIKKHWSKLDMVMILGKKIGDCTVGEVKQWIDLAQKDPKEISINIKFARAVVGAETASGKIIRDICSPVHADALYTEAATKAELENAA